MGMGELWSLTAALAAAALAFWGAQIAFGMLAARGAARRLGAFRGESGKEIPATSRAFRIRLALPWAPEGREEEAFLLARLAAGAAAGAALLALRLPPAMAAAGAVLGYLAAREYVEGRWERFVRDIEGQLPVFLERLAAVIQITPHIPVAVGELVEAMEPGALRAWLERFLARTRQEGEAGWARMEEEASAISPALGLAVFLMRRAYETGGPGYSQALSAASARLSAILAARESARAKADGMMSAVRTMALALGGVLVLFLSNPMMQASVQHPIVQLGYAAAMGVAGYGFFFIRDMVREAI